MSRKVSLEKIDARKANDLLRQLRRMAPHYTKEWPAKDDDDPGVALLKVFSFIAEGVISRLNRAPDRNFLAFLDMLGIRLLPATPARAAVRFLMAKGTEDAVLVPKGAQVTAAPNAQRPTELPFETIENLWAVPATLSELIAVDPGRDSIYKPPPLFLETELATSELPLLTVTAFSSAGSKFLQLDPPDQVKKDDFLRIDQALDPGSRLTNCLPMSGKQQLRVIDHLVVLDAKGTIVTVTDPLPRDYAEGTQVRKVTSFELFEGKNWQEHVLNLAHADYFSIKSEAQIELLVELAGASANLESLDVIWEFFGATETVKEDGWHRFEVELDGTLGFSRSGRVVLNKPAGEIKEKEINGNKSRWIRARLNEPLPSTPIRPLPTIESLTFTVASGGEDLAPDQAFHNDTPLTTDVEFFPFGTEPRIFDRFSIASEEAFSKPGAEIDLTFTLDTADLLASPAGVIAQNKIRVFATAAAGKLLEFQIDPVTSGLVVDNTHGSPKDTRITAGSTPAVVAGLDESFVGVFVKADDGKIHQRFISAITEIDTSWMPLTETEGTLQFSPAAILIDGQWQIYVVADNRLCEQSLSARVPSPGGAWIPVSDSPKIDSSPFLLETNGSLQGVFVTDLNGVTWKHIPGWTDLTPTLSPGVPDPVYLAAKNARPFARTYMDNEVRRIRVYLRNRSNELVALDTEAGKSRSLGAPYSGVGSNPFGISVRGDYRIYVRGAQDNHLWSIKDSPGEEWIDHGTTTDINLEGDPFLIACPKQTQDFVSAFSTSKKNALMEFRARGNNLAEGDIQAGPRDIVLLQEPLPGDDDFYIRILRGPGANSSADSVRKIVQRFTSSKLVLLESPLADSATKDTEYVLLREVRSGSVVDSTETTLTLHEGDGEGVNAGDWVFANNQIRRIPEEPDDDDVTIEPQWEFPPPTGDTYHLLRVVGSSDGIECSDDSARHAVLDLSVSGSGDIFENKFLQITAGPGESRFGRQISNYSTTTNIVVLATEFPEPPTSASQYAITVSSVSEAWYVHEDPDEGQLRPELSWEYYNGRGWLALAIDEDETQKLLVEGQIKFKIPEDMAKTEVAGQENFWIRARIVGGDYGREQFTFDQKSGKVSVEKDPIRPPLVKNLSIKYKLTELKPPQICLTFNNLDYLDQSAANVTDDKHFKPYIPLSDSGKAVYFGFDKSFEGGPVKLYFAAKELEVDDRDKPKLKWEFGSNNVWERILANDGTDAFTKPEFVSLTLPDGFQNNQEFGKALYWVRATLTEGSWKESPLFRGVFLNTVAALQARSIQNEILGSSIGIKNQKFRFQQVPVIEGEEVRVLEVLTDDEREQLVNALGSDAVRNITDVSGRVLQTWIRWTEVPEFFDSNRDSRNYRLDRATGEIEFGDGVRGRMPPAGGDNIQAFAYQTGGGASGNVAPGEITSAVTAVAGVDSVINPVAAGGGSEAATNEEMMGIGPAQISHRERAVTPEDFERLAREASREVRKALCVPNRNASARHELGWTSVHIVPDSKDAEPMPSLELRRAVQRYLANRADVTLVDQNHIFVGPPKYVPVRVAVTVFAKSFDVVAPAEQSVRQKLEQFLHPLTGGPDGEGWEFGRDLAASDLYALLEDISDVDHVGALRLFFGDTESEDRVEVDAFSLIASGIHEINMSVATENG